MNFLLQHIIPFILLYKYTALFLVAFIASFVIPIPSGNVLIASGALSAVGYLNIWIIIPLSIVANILGDNLNYFISYKYGKKALHSIGLRKTLESNKFKKISIIFHKNPGFIIFLSRFEVLSTLFVNFLSGLGHLPYRKFIWHEVTGTIAQVSIYSMIGYFFENNWESIDTIIGKVTLILFLLILLSAIIFSKKALERRLS
jgi:membrane-associated protein